MMDKPTAHSPPPAATALLLCLGLGAYAQAATSGPSHIPPLPMATSNNAVTTVTGTDGALYLISFAGIGPGKTHRDPHARTFVYRAPDQAWHEAPAIPGEVGRLAAAAVTLGTEAYVFGGYSVAEDGSERSTPWVHAFDPVGERFAARQAMPVPVDDAAALTYRDRYVYLISGWHDDGNVNLVQRYDALQDRWEQATPIPGPAVFGHTAGIVDDTIVYCDGVAIAPHRQRRRDFRASAHCYLGHIDPQQPRRIDWRSIDPHPGRPRYRMAGAGDPALGAVVFLGGSTNPYNFDGIGYDGEPATPAADAFAYDLRTQRWRTLHTQAPYTMDHRALVPWLGRWLTVGGMLADQAVTDRVFAHAFSTPPD